MGSPTQSEDAQRGMRIRELPRVSITKDWSDWGIWAFNGLLVLVGAFQLLVLWRQAKIMKVQAEIMAEHAAHLKGLVTAAENNAKAASDAAEAASKNADFSKLNAEATGQNAIAARDNAIAARDNAQILLNSERAWILIDTGDIPDNFEPNQYSLEVLDVRPIVRNTGRTPGWITRGSIRYYTVPDGSQLPAEPDYRGGMADVNVNIILAPNGFIQSMYVPIPFSVFVAVRQGNPKLYVYGFVDYTDFANRQRQSRFCFIYDVPKGLYPQARGFHMAVEVPIAYTQCT